jgi:DNA-binding GntR family transcriptional regulator
LATESTSNGDKRPAVAAVRPQTAEEAVTEAMRQAILKGDLEPGRKLGQKELAEQLGVSRIPLRDALRRLEEEALVRIDGRRGAWVTTLDTRDIYEIYELRILLEDRCMGHVIENISDEEIGELEELARRMDEMESDPVAGRAARRDYYEALYGNAGRPRMSRLILQLRDNVGRYHILSNLTHSHRAHAEQLRCLRERDKAGATRNIAEHLEEARDDLVASLKAKAAEKAAQAEAEAETETETGAAE